MVNKHIKKMFKFSSNQGITNENYNFQTGENVKVL